MEIFLRFHFLVLVLCVVGTVPVDVQPFSYSGNVNSLGYKRDSKFFFAVVRMVQGPCTSSSGQPGTCRTLNECSAEGGISQGQCGSGFGVCCIKQVTCDAIVDTNGTTFINQDYPLATNPRASDNCQIRIKKQKNVCQVKLEFEEFQIGPQDSMTGACTLDRLSIGGVDGTTVPILCGNLTGQHLYIDYGTSDTTSMNVFLNSQQSIERKWKVRINFIECSSVLRAPSGCLQYFTGISGRVSMFNYPSAPHLANLDYMICLRREAGMRTLRWNPCDNSPKGLFMTGKIPDPMEMAMMMVAPTRKRNSNLIFRSNTASNASSDGTTPPTVMSDTTAAISASTGLLTGLENCTTDYIFIPDPTIIPPTRGAEGELAPSSRICGNGADQIMTVFAPYVIHVVTDENEAETDVNNTGLCLQWVQELGAAQ